MQVGWFWYQKTTVLTVNHDGWLRIPVLSISHVAITVQKRELAKRKAEEEKRKLADGAPARLYRKAIHRKMGPSYVVLRSRPPISSRDVVNAPVSLRHHESGTRLRA